MEPVTSYARKTPKGKTVVKPAASGLVPDWKTKRTKAYSPSPEPKHASSPLGGLADEDAHAERPRATSVEHKTRQNEACSWARFFIQVSTNF